MTLDANSLSTNLLVTGMVALLVIVLPLLDGLICRRLGLNLWGGVSTHPQADRLLKIRQAILTAGLVIYMCIFAWLVFFSRSAMDAYVVHVAPLEDLKNAFRTDHGFSDVFSRLFTEGFTAAFANVRLVRPEDIAQFYMNVMVFVPMGYLLPYTFRWFRERVHTRPVGVCFLISFLTENLQLMSQRGLYDLDDMIANTLGGWIGQCLYILLAYVLTHPDWRRQARRDQAWRRRSRKTVLSPMRRKIGANRSILYTADLNAAKDFYADLLGYRILGETMNSMLLTLGWSRIEIIALPPGVQPPPQMLSLSVTGLSDLRQRLLRENLYPGEYEMDPYTGLREFRMTGPDQVLIIVMERGSR